MDKEQLLVSIIIPTYNRAIYLSEAIESVFSQTYKNLEIIIIDDGSIDNTKEMVQEYIKNFKNIRYIYQDHKGLSEARNNGILNSRGELIAFIDDDDLWLSDKLKKQIEIMENNPDVGLVYTKIFIVDERNNRNEILDSSLGKDTFEHLFQRCYIQISTVLVKRGCFEKVGLFDETLITTQDHDMWLRISKLYKHKGINEALVKYRKHSTNMSTINRKKYKDRIKVIRKTYADSNTKISFNTFLIRIAKIHYLTALDFYNKKIYFSAMIEFINAIFNHPLVGLTVNWKKRKHIIYNLLKPYLAIILCFFKSHLALIYEKNEL